MAPTLPLGHPLSCLHSWALSYRLSVPCRVDSGLTLWTVTKLFFLCDLLCLLTLPPVLRISSRKIRWADSPGKQGSQGTQDVLVSHRKTQSPKSCRPRSLWHCPSGIQHCIARDALEGKQAKVAGKPPIGGQATPVNWTSRTFLKLQTSLKKGNECQNIC